MAGLRCFQRAPGEFMDATLSIAICTGFLAASGACTPDVAAEVTKVSLKINSEFELDRACAHAAFEKLREARFLRGDALVVAIVWSCDLQK
jgi:hypothetical protein